MPNSFSWMSLWLYFFQKSSQPTQYSTSTGRSTGTWTGTCRCFWTGMCTWLSLGSHNFCSPHLRKSRGALVGTSQLCWHRIIFCNSLGSKFFWAIKWAGRFLPHSGRVKPNMGCITRDHVLDLGDLYGLLDLRSSADSSCFRWGVFYWLKPEKSGSWWLN